MKYKVLLAILSIWVMALITPAVMTLIDKGNTPYALNLNEEEQKENPEHDADQKQLNYLHHPEIHFLPQQNRVAYRDHFPCSTTPLFEIILPPPEYSA
jgi:hypothetical protein